MMKRLLWAFAVLIFSASAAVAQRTASNPLGGNLATQDAGTCSTANSYLWQVLPANAGTTTLNLAGTFSGTITVRESNNGGGTWTTAGTVTSAGTTTYSTNGFTDFCADLTTYTSGTFQLTISTGLQQVLSTVTVNGSGSSAAALNNNVWNLSPSSCAGAINCTQINANGHVVTDVTSTSTTTVTCPNSDCNFTGTDIYGRPNMAVGQKIWATTQGSGVGVGLLIYTTTVCPVTTVASFSAQSVVLNASCTASGSGNVVLVWGNTDGATLNGVVGTNCVNYSLPSGALVLIERGFANTAPACATGATLAASIAVPGPTLTAPMGDAALVLTPDFNWATCAGASCIGNTSMSMQNIFIWGTGLTSATNANCANGNGKIILTAGQLQTVDMAGVCPGATNMVGINMNVADALLYEGGAQEVGTIACQVGASGQGVLLTNNDCHNYNVASGIGMKILAGATAVDVSSYYYANLQLFGTLTSRGTHIISVAGLGGISVQSGGQWISNSDFVGVDSPVNTNALVLFSGGQVQSSNTKFNTGGATVSINSAGTFIDLGGNTISGTGLINPQSGSVWSGSQIIGGSCTGVVTSAATVGLYGAGQTAATTCTSTTLQGQVVTRAGTLVALSCSATAGNQAGSACTVIKNGSPTALTCSLNGVAFCADTTHTAAYAVGDVIGIEVVAGTSDTLANVKGQVLAW
jgi:hypothetical protein